MMIEPTAIQRANLESAGLLEPGERCFLQYSRGWRWIASETEWVATDAEAADALLERVCTLEARLAEQEDIAKLGNVLQKALAMRS